MKKSENKVLKRTVLLILGLAFIALLYIFFLLPAGNGGIVYSSPTKLGNLEFLFSVYGPGQGITPYFRKPMSVATDAENKIYVSDTSHNRICVFDNNGSFLFQFGGQGIAYPDPGIKANWKPGTFNFPYGIDTDKKTGNIFVADMLNKRIQVFDETGSFLDWFPKTPYGGTSPDIIPTDLAVSDGKVYICNPYQIVIFDANGKFIKDFGMPGTGDGQLDRPNGIDVGTDGTIYVSDCNNLRVQAFTSDGKFKWSYGENTGMSTNAKEKRKFGLPRNLAVGPDGNVYVIDSFHFNINVLSPQGTLLAAMGNRGVDEGTFNFPNGIEVTENKIIYVADKENNRVQAIKLDGFVIEGSN